MEFKNLLKEYNETNKKLETIAENMENEYPNFLKENKAKDFKKIEEYFKTKITRICFLRYENEYNNWANMILINNDIKIELNSSDYWEYGDEKVLYEDDFKRNNYEIFLILEDLYFSYPHIKKEYV